MLSVGNLNDPESKVSKLKKEERAYHLLEELHTLPSVGYLTRVRNTPPKPGAMENSAPAHEGEHGDQEQHG